MAASRLLYRLHPSRLIKAETLTYYDGFEECGGRTASQTEVPLSNNYPDLSTAADTCVTTVF